MSGHPLERFTEELKTFGAQRVADLTGVEADVWVGGIVCGLRPLKTKKGDRMAVFMLDDIAGSIEVVVFPETFGKYGRSIAADAMLLVRGKFEKDEESARIVATELHADRALKERTTREVVDPSAAPPHGRRRSKRSPSCCRAIAATGRVSLELDVKRQRPAAAGPRRRRPARAAVREAGRGSRADLRRGIGGAAMIADCDGYEWQLGHRIAGAQHCHDDHA